MTKRNITFLGIWIISWSIFAINQISFTYNHLISSNVPSETLVVSEKSLNNSEAGFNKDQNDFVGKDAKELSESICFNEEFWSSVDAGITEDKRNFTISFPSIPNKNDIKSIEIIVKPMTINYESSKNAFHMHSIYQSRLNTNLKEHEFQLDLINGIDTNYSYLVRDWKLDIIASSNNLADCYESTVLRFNSADYESISNLSVFYEKNIISPIFEKNYDVQEFQEQQYLNQIFQKLQLKKIQKVLPPPHEAALALLNKDVKYDFKKSKKGEKYVDEYISTRKRLSGEVNIGLFGNATNYDLHVVNKVLNILNIIAPNLKISYSDNPADVNLPIHFAHCTKRFSELVNDCRSKIAGTFYHRDSKLENAKFGWIWVDSQYSKSMREHILIHELGHALGLGHNLCTNSVMSYAKFADSMPYFTEIDLMQLRILYDPKLDEIYNNYQVIEDLDLDLDTYSEYADNSKPMCSPQQGGWKDFIEFQKGLKPIDEFLSY